MIKIQSRKSKSTQYVIGGTVAVVILGAWISFPLMSGSSMDASVSNGNPFKSKVVDITTLGSDIPSEGGAPGSPLSGEMINNPATSGENIASSLFQSGPSEEEAPAASAPGGAGSASADAGALPGGPSASGAGGAKNFGKLATVGSITGGNSNTMTTGGSHNQFFGAGNLKSEFAPATTADIKKGLPTDKKSGLLAALTSSADKSQLAAKTGDIGAAKSVASTAFGGSAKAGGADLGGNLEQASSVAGLQLGETAQSLKKNDPTLNKTKITPPSEPKQDEDESDQFKKQILQMIIQMLMQSMLGAVFGTGTPAK